MGWLILLIIAVALVIASFSVFGAVISVLWALIIGAVVGLIANWLVSLAMPGEGPRGFFEAALAGIIGSFVATLLVGMHGLGWTLVGAIIVVVLWKLIAASIHGGAGYGGPARIGS